MQDEDQSGVPASLLISLDWGIGHNALKPGKLSKVHTHGIIAHFLPLFAFLALACGRAGAELDPVHGKFGQTFSNFGQHIRGFDFLQERVDGELEANFVNDRETQQWAARLSPWVWVCIPNMVGGNGSRTQAFLELKEGWVERSSAAWDLRVGNQLISWGAADLTNPTDVWNPRDFSDPFDSRKLPMPTVRLKIHPPPMDQWGLELDFTPFFREYVFGAAELPPMGSYLDAIEKLAVRPT